MANIFKNGKSWAYRVSYIDKNGKQRRPSKSGFSTKAKAAQAALDFERSIKIASDPTSIDLGFLEYYDSWLETYKIGKNSRITEQRYLTFRKALLEYFGDGTRLKDVNRSTWQSFINEYASGSVCQRGKVPKKRSKDTVSKINGYIRSMADDAIADGIISVNFASKTINPGEKASSDNLKFLEADDFAKLKDYTINNASLARVYNYIILTAILTGARASEILALQWRDIDFRNKIIHITKSWDYVFTKTFKPTKTSSGVRDIEVSNTLLASLKELREAQQKNYLKTGYRDNLDMVFRNNRREIPGDAALNKDLRKVLNEIDAHKIISFHGLRHTHVSFLLASGVDIAYISKRLGHSDITITLRVYQHLLDKHKNEQASIAIRALDNL